jgi:hypothetical protein
MPATNVTLNNILNYNFGIVTYNPANPATMYWGMCTSILDPTIVLGSTIGTAEPSGNGYARVSFTNSQTAWWSNATAQTLNNAHNVQFPSCSSSPWGTMQSLFISDNATTRLGNILWYIILNPSIVVQVGTQVTFASATIVITI